MKDANGETFAQLLRSLVIVICMALTIPIAILIMAHFTNITINF